MPRARNAGALLPPLVLAYHGVGAPPAEDRWGLMIDPRLLRSHIVTLKRLGYRFVTAEQLVDAGVDGPPPRGTAALTFDDGWLDGLTVALPLLKALGVPATFYVNPGRWGGLHREIQPPAGRLLDPGQVRSLARSGMAIGAHGMLHADLRGLDDAELEADLRQCKAEIEAATEVPCRTLAYPFGAFDARVEAAARATGYDLAFAWETGPWRAHAAPRLPVGVRHGGLRLLMAAAGVRRRRTIGPPPDPPSGGLG